MALTFTKTRSGVMGDVRYWFGDITFDSSYPTGGEAIAKSDFGFPGAILHVQVNPVDDAGYDAWYDHASSKIKLYDEDNTSGIAAEPTNTSDQSGRVVRVTAFGF